MRTKFLLPACALALAMYSLGCGDESPASNGAPWSAQTTQVIDAQRNVKTLSGSPANGCLDYEGECLKSTDKCGDLAADVVLDARGKVLDYLCYPAESTLSVEQLESQQGDLAQNENNSVIVLDGLDDGDDISGDVSVDANNVVLYGSSPDESVIAGSLTLDGNNALVRGVRLKGDVTILKNDAVLAFCVIEGDLLIEGNNARVLACDVLGTVTVRGNNAQLLGARIAGALSVAKDAECQDSVAFTDVDRDQSVDTTELGSPIDC